MFNIMRKQQIDKRQADENADGTRGAAVRDVQAWLYLTP